MYTYCVFDFITCFYFLDIWNHLYSEGFHRREHGLHTQHHQRAIQCRRGPSSGATEICKTPFFSVLGTLGKNTEECLAESPAFGHISKNQIRYFQPFRYHSQIWLHLLCSVMTGFSHTFFSLALFHTSFLTCSLQHPSILFFFRLV